MTWADVGVAALVLLLPIASLGSPKAAASRAAAPAATTQKAAATAEASASPPGDCEPGSAAEGSSRQCPPEPAKASSPARTYTVRRGDRLSKIAKRFQVGERALAEANGIRNRDRIRAGARLRIPAAAGATKQSAKLSVGRSAGKGVVASQAAQRAKTALEYRGVPYRYAGMSSRGMDCSGLVARVLRGQGLDAPHSSQQLYKLGHPVSRQELRSGDLVFFHTRGRGISHVGIYIGNGDFVHASSGGGRVKVDTLDSGYYAQRLVGARRVP